MEINEKQERQSTKTDESFNQTTIVKIFKQNLTMER